MKHCIGFDIGNHAIHVAVRKGDNIVRGLTERLAQDLVKNGAITSFEVMTDFLKELKKKEGLTVRDAALVLPAAHCYCRRFFVAANTRDQLMFNLPYGFKDFITDDKSNYFFDCAVLNAVRYGDGRPPEFDVLAVAARKETIEDYINLFRRAGFKLKTIIPEEFAYVNLLRKMGDESHHHGILDIGHNAVKLFFFNGSMFDSVRVIDYGLNALDEVISEQFGVDNFVAGTYRENDFNGANNLDGCRAIYGAMALEVLKAINFYRFNGGSLQHLHCCGGGSHNEALMQSLRTTLPVEISDMKELFAENKGKGAIDYPLIAAAAGAALQ